MSTITEWLGGGQIGVTQAIILTAFWILWLRYAGKTIRSWRNRNV